MNYNIFSQARNKSWQTLIECGISTMPIKPVKIAAYYGIECHLANKSAMLDASGMLRTVKNKLCIFVDNSDSIQRQRFTILHELGHYLLGHLGDEVLFRCYENIRSEKEQAADKFAADTLMSACVLWGLNIYKAEDIAKICNVSMTAAKIRAERMQILYQRNKFLSHPLEKQVFGQFQQFINNYQNLT